MPVTINGTSGVVTATSYSGAGGDLTGITTGKILQVVTVTKTDRFSVGSNASWHDVTGMSVNITPTSASNKILFMMTLYTGADTNSFTRMMRDSTPIGVGTAATGSQVNVTTNPARDKNDTAQLMPQVMHVLDSPNTTSQVTYKVQFRSYGASTYYVYLNRARNDENNNWHTCTASSITAMEVAA
tara:strand:+ start:2268 stop:2822 length:555 start_codon:yes stop_codon:yes gene_type:complete